MNEAQTEETAGGSYKWCTVGDDKVRSAHAEREGQIFSWDSPPEGGHPGEDYNCRCWAEDVSDNTQKPEEPQEAEGLEQVVTSEIKDASKKWTDKDFVYHFYFGGGDDVTLPQIGLLGAIIDHAQDIMFDKVLKQVADEAKSAQNGNFAGSWKNSYPFGSVVFSIGGATIEGRFAGTVKKDGKILTVDAKAEYEFSDTFTDPASKRQKKLGSSAIEKIPYDSSKPWWSPGNIGAAYYAADTEYMGTPYAITGNWTTRITGSISAEDE